MPYIIIIQYYNLRNSKTKKAKVCCSSNNLNVICIFLWQWWSWWRYSHFVWSSHIKVKLMYKMLCFFISFVECSKIVIGTTTTYFFLISGKREFSARTNKRAVWAYYIVILNSETCKKNCSDDDDYWRRWQLCQ